MADGGYLAVAFWGVVGLVSCGGQSVSPGAEPTAGAGSKTEAPSVASSAGSSSDPGIGGESVDTETQVASGGRSDEDAGTSEFGSGGEPTEQAGSGGSGPGGSGASPSAGLGGAPSAGTAGANLAGAGSESRVTHVWQFPSSDLDSMGLLLTTDLDGNIVAVGETDDPLAANLSVFPEGSTRAVVVTTYAPNGTVLSLRSYPSAASPEAITVTPSGALVIAGQLYIDMDFGGGVLPAQDPGYYVVWLDGESGEVLDQRAVAMPYASMWLRAAASDAEENVYIAGEATVTSPTWMSSVFVSQFSSSSADGWAQVFPGCDSTAVANDIEVTPEGTLAIAGAFNCTLTIGDQQWTSQAYVDGFSTYNGFVAELDAETGSPLFSMRFGGAIFDMARVLDVTSDGHYRILGTLSGSSEIGGTPVEALQEGSTFVADLNADGTANWVELVERDAVGFGSVTSDAGVTYVAGRFEGPSDLPYTTVDGAESCLLAIGPAGGFRTLWTALTQSNGARSAAIDGVGGLWVTGELGVSADLGLGVVSEAAGNQYLIRLSP